MKHRVVFKSSLCFKVKSYTGVIIKHFPISEQCGKTQICFEIPEYSVTIYPHVSGSSLSEALCCRGIISCHLCLMSFCVWEANKASQVKASSSSLSDVLFVLVFFFDAQHICSNSSVPSPEWMRVTLSVYTVRLSL